MCIKLIFKFPIFLIPQSVPLQCTQKGAILHTAMPKHSEESVERVILKLPKSVASYFRKEFPHGKRSQFVADCILAHQHEQEIAGMEHELRKVSRKR